MLTNLPWGTLKQTNKQTNFHSCHQPSWTYWMEHAPHTWKSAKVAWILQSMWLRHNRITEAHTAICLLLQIKHSKQSIAAHGWRMCTEVYPNGTLACSSMRRKFWQSLLLGCCKFWRCWQLYIAMDSLLCCSSWHWVEWGQMMCCDIRHIKWMKCIVWWGTCSARMRNGRTAIASQSICINSAGHWHTCLSQREADLIFSNQQKI